MFCSALTRSQSMWLHIRLWWNEKYRKINLFTTPKQKQGSWSPGYFGQYCVSTLAPSICSSWYLRRRKGLSTVGRFSFSFRETGTFTTSCIHIKLHNMYIVLCPRLTSVAVINTRVRDRDFSIIYAGSGLCVDTCWLHCVLPRADYTVCHHGNVIISNLLLST